MIGMVIIVDRMMVIMIGMVIAINRMVVITLILLISRCSLHWDVDHCH